MTEGMKDKSCSINPCSVSTTTCSRTNQDVVSSKTPTHHHRAITCRDSTTTDMSEPLLAIQDLEPGDVCRTS